MKTENVFNVRAILLDVLDADCNTEISAADNGKGMLYPDPKLFKKQIALEGIGYTVTPTVGETRFQTQSPYA